MNDTILRSTIGLGLAGWLKHNNRHRYSKGMRQSKQQRQRLQRATGPGSYDEWKQALAAERAAKRAAS